MRIVRAFTLLLILTLLAFPQSGSEIKRPTSDADTSSSSWVTTNCGIGTAVANTTAGTLARDAAGQSTSISYAISSGNGTKKTARQFSNWDTTANSYSALTLNVNSKSQGWAISDSTGNACLAYSIDAGSTWTQIRCDGSGSGWTQVTNTVSLSATQDLSRLRVGVCALAHGSTVGKSPDIEVNLGSDNVQVYDIWTNGTTGAAGNGNGSGSGNANAPVQFN